MRIQWSTTCKVSSPEKPHASFFPSGCIGCLVFRNAYRRSPWHSAALPVLAQGPEAPLTAQSWLLATPHQTHQVPLRPKLRSFLLAHFLLIKFNPVTSPRSGPRGPSKTKISMFAIRLIAPWGTLCGASVPPHSLPTMTPEFLPEPPSPNPQLLSSLQTGFLSTLEVGQQLQFLYEPMVLS